jgi:ribosomal protein S12 methylthiotransferase accessory factor
MNRITIDLVLPSDFPEKYKKALIHSVDLCAVKRTILDPPEFEIKTVTAD